jgi:hypothetical protein
MFAKGYIWHWLTMVILGLMLFPPLEAQAKTVAPTTSFEVATPFQTYYNQHQGVRVLGYPISQLITVGGYSAQYFEKGRIEDHRQEISNPNWAFMYGRLTAELMEQNWSGSVNATTISYADLHNLAAPANRQAPPPGFTQGTRAVRDEIFVPYDPQLRKAPGHYVPIYFWVYMNRTELFPGGWLHDIGLPMTQVFMVDTYKFGLHRTIAMQAFERSVLTFDPLNPAEWQVERGNIGTDLLNVLQSTPAIEFPTPWSRQTLPLHIFARVGRPGEQIEAVLHWQDGTELRNSFVTLSGEDGRGLLINSLNWKTEGMPPQVESQFAMLQLRNSTGKVITQQPLNMLKGGDSDPESQLIMIYWVLGGEFRAQWRYVPRTDQIGTAALNELLWGPIPPNLADFSTALPSPQQVLTYPGRTPDWGPRVTLRKLTIVDGVATADFSKELRAYGGGSLRVMQIRQQINLTLKQFPTVREVRIAIEGQTQGVLEP